jgi:hypothetical protein
MVAVILGIEKAFDNGWHDEIHYEIIALSFPDCYVYKGEGARKKSIRAKVPQ